MNNLAALTLSSLVLASFASAQTFNAPLGQPLASPNQGNPGGGVYIDLNVTTTVTLLNLTYVASDASAAGNSSLNVYVGPPTWVGQVSANPGPWTLFASTTPVAIPGAVDTPVTGVLHPAGANPGSVTFGPGAYGIALQAVGHSWGYQSGAFTFTAPGGEFTVSTGGASNAFLTLPTFTPRTINGSIAYTVGGAASNSAAVSNYGEMGQDSAGNPIRLEAGDFVVGSATTLAWNHGPVPLAGMLALANGRNAIPIDNVLLQLDLPFAGTVLVNDGPNGITTYPVALPNNPTLLDALFHWQAFPVDLALASLPIAWSNGVATRVGNAPALPTAGLDVEFDPEDQALVGCPGGQKRYQVTGWRRRTTPQGAQTVEVWNGATLVTDGSVAPGCVQGKIYTDTVRICLPANPTLDHRWQDCGEPPVTRTIPGAALAIVGIPDTIPPPLPTVGVLVNPLGPWAAGAQWSSSRPHILHVTPAGIWTALQSGRAWITFRGVLMTPQGPIEVKTGKWVRVL